MRAFLKAGLCLAALLSATSATAQVTVDQLAKPPADAQKYTILSKTSVLGHATAWTAPGGVHMVRESLNLRGQIFELDEATTYGPDGEPSSQIVRGFTPNGDAGETFAVKDGQASWKSQVDEGHAAYGQPALYIAFGGTNLGNSMLIESILAQPGHSVALLPGGRATAERVAELEVGEGAARKKIVCWAVSGLGTSPVTVWTTEDGKFFGVLNELPEGYESAYAAIDKAQDDALAARSPTLAHSLAKTPAGPVAFTHVRAFVGGTHFEADQTVVVDRGVITKVGPSASTRPPAGAQIIDGKGETLVPGLWDSHQHVPDDYAGPFLLSLGITSARDPGNDNELTLARAERRAKGDLLMPHVYPSSLIDGKGPMTAQVGTSVSSLDEALAAVRKAKADGFVAVKFYGTFNPDWVKPAASEAHRLGLHVHGHLPAGMRTSRAIADGYDEITHIYFVTMEAMPDDVVKTSNGINRFNGTARYAKDLDLTKDPMKSLIATMAKRHIVSDPTLVIAEGLYVPENGDMSPAVAPYVGTLPPATERGAKQGGFAVPKDLTRADYRKSFAKLLDVVETMHKAGVPIVAGTDGSGMELVRELELYVRAGFTPEEALESATIVPARNVHADRTTGSIEVGKTADLVLVEGDPAHNIGDLRNTRAVMMDGKLMDADALRAAAGFSGRPHPAD
jgi:imidazolonepropionase-like amidohydrolase